MRKRFLFLMGALSGASLTLLVTAPQGEYWIAKAKAAATAADTYSQLNLFGEVFERVRADYVEKPDDSSLADRRYAGVEGRHHVGRSHQPDRRRAGSGPLARAGRQQDEGRGQHQDPP